MNILLLDDDLDLTEVIKKTLMDYNVFQCSTLAEARASLELHPWNLILIDLSLPDGNGFDFCTELNMNQKYTTTPKIILSANSETRDKVFGFHCGATDYICKPFSPEELKARVQVRIKEVLPTKNNELFKSKIGSFVFDFNLQKCLIEETNEPRDLQLTPTEFKIFNYILTEPGKVRTRKEIADEIWRTNGLFVESRGIDAHISHIRKKLAEKNSLLQSIYGKGYFYNAKDDAKFI